MARPEEEQRAGESDSVLLDRARDGDDAAFETLWLRHVDAAREVAERVSTPARAPDLVGEAFTRTLTTIRGGGGPDDAFRPYLLATVRRLAAVGATGAAGAVGAEGGGPDAGLALVGTDRDAAWAAWKSLPGDERDLLWRLVVHEQSPAELAPVLGTTPDGVVALGRRAGDRLRRAYLADLVNAAPDAECRAVRRLFGAYGRDALPEGERARVDTHLDTCDRCREAVAGLVDVTELIRAGVGPHLLPGLFGADDEGAEAGPDVMAADAADDPDDTDDTGDDDGPGLLAGVTAPGAALAATSGGVAGASGRSDARRLDLPLVLVGGAAVVAVAGIAVLLALLGGGSPASDVAAGRPTTSATRPAPDTVARPLPNVVVAVPTLPSTVTTAVQALSTSTVEAVSVAARVARPGTTAVASRRTRAGTPATTPAPTRTATPTRTPRPTTTAPPPQASPTVVPGVPTVLGFEPSSDRRYSASVVAPPGWLITSVRDVRGGRQVEHVGAPTQTFEGTLRPGSLVVEVTPQSGARSGSLVTRFADRGGALLPGSGSHPVPAG
ncbi:sigma-70 family RNA polymerase sigma factor [Intrasporangium sp. YIM S08009]|uniref:sigma-70 family RNA polymerase sigma factor n=1 Tax=Intrasporangium zincisolvens TaxID=3080018 RepID=UPI002B058A8A|nr:sigma-70 family RNA polymerase sigma factor [Intrasporangium sp. YIM S08009]